MQSSKCSHETMTSKIEIQPSSNGVRNVTFVMSHQISPLRSSILAVHSAQSPFFLQTLSISLFPLPSAFCPSVYVMRNSLVPQRYEQIKEYIKKKLSSCTALSIILDIWSWLSMVGYIGFTCSGVLKTYEPFKCFLSIRQVKGKHTGEAILNEYEDVIQEWDIPISKIVRVITDGGSNMIRLFNIKFPTNQSETLTQSSVEQVERSKPDPNPSINIADSERLVEIEIELDDDSSLWGRIDDIQLSCQEIDKVFDQMNEEEEVEMTQVEKSLQDSFFDVG